MAVPTEMCKIQDKDISQDEFPIKPAKAEERLISIKFVRFFTERVTVNKRHAPAHAQRRLLFSSGQHLRAVC